MLDWFIVVTPLLLVPLLFLLVFVGCGFDAVGSAPPAPPPPPPSAPAPPPGSGSGGGGTGGPGPGPGGTGGSGPGIPISTTRFQLNLDPALQPSFGVRVRLVDAQWILKHTGTKVGQLPAPPLHFAPKDPARTYLEYGVDDFSQHVDATDAELGTADAVACTCLITYDDGTTRTVDSSPPDAPVVKQSCQLYTLRPLITGVALGYSLIAESASGC